MNAVKQEFETYTEDGTQLESVFVNDDICLLESVYASNVNNIVSNAEEDNVLDDACLVDPLSIATANVSYEDQDDVCLLESLSFRNVRNITNYEWVNKDNSDNDSLLEPLIDTKKTRRKYKVKQNKIKIDLDEICLIDRLKAINSLNKFYGRNCEASADNDKPLVDRLNITLGKCKIRSKDLDNVCLLDRVKTNKVKKSHQANFQDSKYDDLPLLHRLNTGNVTSRNCKAEENDLDNVCLIDRLKRAKQINVNNNDTESNNPVYTGKKRHHCNICHKRYRERVDLIEHMRRHIRERPHVCNSCHICRKIFPKKMHLTEHIRTHTEAEPYEFYSCRKHCYKRSITKAMHKSEALYKCDICHMFFINIKMLKRHRNNHNTYQCYICHKFLSSLASHNRHMLAHKRDHICNVCYASFANSDQLKYHKRTLFHLGKRGRKSRKSRHMLKNSLTDTILKLELSAEYLLDFFMKL